MKKGSILGKATKLKKIFCKENQQEEVCIDGYCLLQ